METDVIDKSKMLDSGNKPLTQSLFLEIGYTKEAIYTLKEDDHIYDGRIYPSLKKLYLLCEDPTEYEFATTYLLGWKHWQRLCDNKVIRKYIDEWREELEVKLRSKAVREMLKSAQGGSFQAAKFLADRGWDTRGAGRPSKAEVEKEKAILSRVDDEFSADVIRLKGIK